MKSGLEKYTNSIKYWVENILWLGTAGTLGTPETARTLRKAGSHGTPGTLGTPWTPKTLGTQETPGTLGTPGCSLNGKLFSLRQQNSVIMIMVIENSNHRFQLSQKSIKSGTK